MRENRTSGSEGGEGHTLPDPYHVFLPPPSWPKDVDGRNKSGHDEGLGQHDRNAV